MLDLVGNPVDRFSHKEAHLRSLIMRKVSYMFVRVYDHVHGVQHRMISVVNFSYF